MSFHQPTDLPFDSDHYDMLYRAAQAIKDVPGVTLEIGLRRGGGTETIVRGCLDNGDPRVHMAIDPYGHLPYPAGAEFWQHFDYDNDMRMQTMAAVYPWCKERHVTLVFWPMTDAEFFRAFPDGPPFYDNDQERRVTEFALVHFDGPHSWQTVRREVDYFAKFAPLGAQWVFDDTEWYPHMEFLDPEIWLAGFDEIERTTDAHVRVRYQKTRQPVPINTKREDAAVH